MSQKEVNRAQVLDKLNEGKISQQQAAKGNHGVREITGSVPREITQGNHGVSLTFQQNV